MRRYRIAVIPGDGIGKEVIPAGLEVLKAVAEREGGLEFAFDQFDWGSDYYRSTGLMMPADGREQIANTTRSWSGTKRASRWRGEIREGARPQVILSSGTAIRQTTPEAGY
jgi:isocitrate/isopropylmalate dehydrogenase